MTREHSEAQEHARKLALEWLSEDGYDPADVVDMVLGEPLEFVSSHDPESTVLVEIHGTTGVLEPVVVTESAVRAAAGAARLGYRTLLIVVHGIQLTGDGEQPSGGTVHVVDPWLPLSSALSPATHFYDPRPEALSWQVNIDLPVELTPAVLRRTPDPDWPSEEVQDSSDYDPWDYSVEGPHFRPDPRLANVSDQELADAAEAFVSDDDNWFDQIEGMQEYVIGRAVELSETDDG